MRKPRHGSCLRKLSVGFCEPDARSSINSCLQRSSRLPANFNGPLTHGYRRFLTPRDVVPLCFYVASSFVVSTKGDITFIFSFSETNWCDSLAWFPRVHEILLLGGYKISVSVIFKDKVMDKRDCLKDFWLLYPCKFVIMIIINNNNQWKKFEMVNKFKILLDICLRLDSKNLWFSSWYSIVSFNFTS